MKIINDTVPSYNEKEPEQFSLDDVKNMYFTDYAGNYTQTDAIVAGVQSTGMQLEKTLKFGVPQAAGAYLTGAAEPVADIVTKAVKPLAAVFPDGGKILDGSVKMEIADKIKERGKVLIETANRNLEMINEEYAKNNPYLKELQSKVGFDIGAQGSQYGAMLLSGYFSPVLSGIAMGGMVYAGEAEESLEKYKEENNGSIEGYEKQASQDLFWDAANSYVQGVIETKFGAGAQTRAFKGVKDILKNFVRGYVQESGEEVAQDAVDFAFDKFRGRLTEDETLLKRFQDNLRGYVVAGLFGGSTGMAFATYNRYKGIETATQMAEGVVPPEQQRALGEAIYNGEAKTLEDVVTISLATSSSLQAKRGDVYNNVVDTILKAVNKSRKQGGYASIKTDEEAIEYAKAEADRFSDRVVKEAFLRNKDITQVFNAEKVGFEKGKIVLPMTEGLRQVEKAKIDNLLQEKKPSMLQFIRSKGGIKDESGELKSRDASKVFIGLVNKNGNTIDEMGEKLMEEGYFLERPTVAQVLDFIDDELKGIKHYPVGYSEEQSKSRKQAEEMINEYIKEYADAMGYDLKNMSYNEKVEVYEQMNRNLNAQGLPTFDELSEDQQERVAMMMENGLSEEEAIYMLGLPEYMQESFSLESEQSQSKEYDPRSVMPKVRGGWTKAKILRYMKDWHSLSGVTTATRKIAEFDSVEDFKNHMFYHGSKYGTSKGLKPSMTMSDREVERIGGGGYGEKYWAISLSKSKKIAGTFATSNLEGRGNIYPVLLVKNAKVIEMPELSDSADLDEHIEELYNDGVDAVWIGDKNKGEQELAVINPRAVVNIGTSEFYRAYRLGQPENPINIKSDEEIQKIYDFAKDYVRKYPRRGQAPSEAIEDARKMVFWQRGRGENASISFFPDKALINLTETADAHSLPHEFEHYWLQNTFLYTKTSQASPEYKKTFQAVADFLGITEDQEKIYEWQHEKFARSWEEYLRTAKAPNPDVKAAFDDYTKWLRNVYRRLKTKPRYRGEDGKLIAPRLTPAIIDYFNSMFGYIPDAEMAEEMTVTPEIEKAAVKVAQDFEKVIEPTKEVKSEVKEEIKPEVKTEEEPKKKISRYAERTARMQVEYEGITIADQLEKAQEFVKNNLKKAEEIVKGGQAPDGLTRNAVLLAYIDYMKSKGKAKEASDAIVELSLSGTKQGQEISMLRVANNNPTEFDYWINKVVDVRRKNNIAKHFRTEAKAEEYIKETAKAIYEEMKGKTGKERAKIAEKWQKIVAEKGLTLYQMDDETYNSIDKIENKLNKALDGEKITEEQADKLFEMTNDLRNSFEETQSENGNPSIETLKKLKEINDYSNSLNPTAHGIIFSSLYGRSVMLMSVKSPVLNIISNIETFTAEKASRYAINVYNGLSNDNLVDKKKINNYREWSKQVYNETGIMSSVVDNLFDEAKVLGETRDSSQGKGKFRALSRFVEDIAFQKLMGAPDNYWKDITFVDVAGNKATQKAYEEGLKGEEARKRANELFDDAILYTPQTEEGQEIRKSAMIATHEATFTQDSAVAKFSLKIREALNMISGRHFRLGEMILPFVKTPANVQMLGIEASVGFLYTAYHIKDIVANPKSTVSQRAIQAGFRNGVGIILAILVASSFDDDEDYIPEYDNASPKQRDIARLKNAPFNSVKIGGKYISLDYFGPLGVPLAGILKARKSDNKIWEYLKGVVGQGMKVPGVKEIQALTGDISRAIEYKKTSDQVAKDVMEWAGEQAYSRAVPSFVSDVAKFIDTYERETGGEFSNRIKAKIPVLREELPIKTDISGRRVEGEGILGVLFGARVKTANESKIVKEISRLNKSGNAPTLSDPTRYGKFRDLIPELKNKIRSEFNIEYGKKVGDLISKTYYQKMADTEKKKQLNIIRREITDKLKKTYGLDKKK